MIPHDVTKYFTMRNDQTSHDENKDLPSRCGLFSLRIVVKL